ncbi:MAG: amidohydrolase family protein [Planctomycetota bacterium]|jgi:dihydroorotase|nr:amidohydrolase family protein [Planctomycetota bacterium]
MAEPNADYDLVLAGGRVICPSGRIDARLDVAISQGKIARLGDKLSWLGRETIDCSDKIVTPGLIDSHAHFHSSSHSSLDTDEAGIWSGAVAVMDGGSSGYLTFDEFRRRDLEGKITDAGCLIHHNPLGQATLPEVWNPGRIRFFRERLVETIHSNRDRVFGLKDRAVGTFVGCRGIGGVEEAREICAECGIPYVIHLGVDPADEFPDRELDAFTRDLLGLLAPGDIIAHACTGKRGGLFREDGALDRPLREAVERGVLLDCCSGATNFSVRAFRLGRERGFLPHLLSTDITSMSARGPARNLGVVMSKFLALGIDLPTIVAWTTSAPAKALGMAGRKGSLAIGQGADITVSELRKGNFRFLDRLGGEIFSGNELLVPRLAFLSGKKYEVRNSGPPTLPE